MPMIKIKFPAGFAVPSDWGFGVNRSTEMQSNREGRIGLTPPPSPPSPTPTEMEAMDDVQLVRHDRARESQEGNEDLKGFYFTRRNQNPHDVKFVVGGSGNEAIPPEIFKAHKLVLIQESTVFAAMFNGQMVEGGPGQKVTIEIPDIEPDAFGEVLQCLYDKFLERRLPPGKKMIVMRSSASTSLRPKEFDLSLKTTKFLGHLFYAADKYDLGDLARMCLRRMNDRLDVKDAVMIYQYCVGHPPAHSLESMAKDFIIKSFDEIVLDEVGFLDFTRENLMTFMACDQLQILEHDLFTAVLKWAQKQCINESLEPNMSLCREVLGDDMITLIRFRTISSVNLLNYVLPTGFLTPEERSALIELNASVENGSDSSRTDYDLPILRNGLGPRAPYSGFLLIKPPIPDHCNPPIEESTNISDQIEGTHDFQLTFLTYNLFQEIIPDPPLQGQFTIEDMRDNVVVFVSEVVTSQVQTYSGDITWIQFHFNMNSIVLWANTPYKVSLQIIGPDVGPEILESLNLDEDENDKTFRFNERFMIKFFPIDQAIHKIGFTLV